MKIRQATFISSNTVISACPRPTLPEYAFIGRSNVGKSSLINMLTGQKNLARTSSRPGKTQTIQHYLINEEWYLVDLPGLGYAKAPRTHREKWQKMIFVYLRGRINLLNTFVLIDSRLEPQEIDLSLVNWMGENQIPFTILFTKTDKTSTVKGKSNMEAFRKAMLQTWENLPECITTSTVTGKGKEEIIRLIGETNRIFNSKGIDEPEVE